MSKFEIIANNLCLDIRSKTVLKDISVTFNSGLTYLLYGRNGAGKSSLINCLLNFEKGFEGQLLFLKNGEKLRQENLKKAYLPEELDMPVEIKIDDFQNSFKMLLEDEQRFNDRLFKYLSEKFELDSFEAKKFGQLSKGMKKLILISTILSSESDLIVLDEPLEGLDSLCKEYLIEILVNEARKGKIVIISSHEIATINNRFDSIISLKNGRITKILSKNEVEDYKELLSLI